MIFLQRINPCKVKDSTYHFYSQTEVMVTGELLTVLLAKGKATLRVHSNPAEVTLWPRVCATPHGPKGVLDGQCGTERAWTLLGLTLVCSNFPNGMKKYMGEGGVPAEKLKLVTERKCLKSKKESILRVYLWIMNIFMEYEQWIIIKMSLLQILFCKIRTISNFF